MTPIETGEARRESPAEEVWLRGNLRPVAVLAAASLAGLALCAAAMLRAGGMRMPPAAAVAGAAVVSAVLLALAALAAGAARPRLARRGDRLVVRLSPAGVAAVPRDGGECFFQGSNPLDRQGQPTCGDHASCRVNTLVMRLAERAEEHRMRRTFTPWGTWDDGYVVFDGRWCEPLSADLARALSRRLLDAKREAAEAAGGR